MSKQNLKPIAAAVGTAFIASLATASVAFADSNPFGVGPLDDSHEILLAGGDTAAGEGKCGEDSASGDDGEGSCGEDTDDGNGSDDDDDDTGEGSCGA